jgi:hypothetical protein
MTKPWKGKIAVDIRESKPDWEPYIQPQAPARIGTHFFSPIQEAQDKIREIEVPSLLYVC